MAKGVFERKKPHVNVGTMVDVTDGADVHVRLLPFKYALSHCGTPILKRAVVEAAYANISTGITTLGTARRSGMVNGKW